jgi:hypothetical protein
LLASHLGDMLTLVFVMKYFAHPNFQQDHAGDEYKNRAKRDGGWVHGLHPKARAHQQRGDLSVAMNMCPLNRVLLALQSHI